MYFAVCLSVSGPIAKSNYRYTTLIACVVVVQ